MRISNDTNHFPTWSSPLRHYETLADGRLARPDRVRHALVYDRDQRISLSVAGQYTSPADYPKSSGCKELSRHPGGEDTAPRQVANAVAVRPEQGGDASTAHG